MTTAGLDRGFAPHWRRAYGELGERLPELAVGAKPLLAGFCACVDKAVDLHVLASTAANASDPRARAFLDDMLSRASSGRGGETLVDWPDGPAFLDRFVRPGAMSLGGTSAQAAWTLAAVGASAILALGDRSPDQLAVLHPDILFADAQGELIRTPDLVPTGTGKSAHYIVEYFAGRPLIGFTPNRSTRVIVRFADEEIERDPNFRAYARAHAADCGPALLSSPNAIPPGRFEAALNELSAAASEWASSGSAMIHLELGDYARPGTRDAAVSRLAPVITSLGFNLHELDGFDLPGESPATRTLELARRLGVARLAVHADTWALAAVQGDPAREREALMLGCLLASARAAAGKPVRTPTIPEQAELTPPPTLEVETRPGGWSIISVPAPFLRSPVSTLGLGDTFTAGTMLAHAQPGDSGSRARAMTRTDTNAN
jgi:ADP-dependent phosphofructokinase/glucokinase